MDEYTPFWIIFSAILGILYYHFSIAKIPVISKLTQSLLNIRDALKTFTRGKFILGIVLIGFSQLNLLTPGLSSYLSVHGLFSIPLTDNVFSLDIVNSADVLANILLLLAGCFLLVSALRDADAIPEEKEPALLFEKFLGFSKGRLLPMRVVGFALSFYLPWQLHSQSEEFYLIGVWLVAIIIFGYLVTRLDLQNGVFHGFHIRRSDALWLAGLFLLGLIVGMYRLQSIPNLFVGDEGSFWDLASSFASGAIRPVFFGNGVDDFPNLSSLGQAFVLSIFGISMWSWRFSSLLAGLLTIIPLYLLARELFGRQVAVVSCVAMVTSEYFLAFSRLGYNSSQTLFPVTLALYFISTGH